MDGWVSEGDGYCLYIFVNIVVDSAVSDLDCCDAHLSNTWIHVVCFTNA